jgi:membrane-bound lytic murein transglycosylase B
MQFMPGTWQGVGEGDISSPHDSIMAAARLLRLNGAPADYAQAIFRYNNDANYVESVQRLAAAMRADPLWLWRLYYWNTYG